MSITPISTTGTDTTLHAKANLAVRREASFAPKFDSALAMPMQAKPVGAIKQGHSALTVEKYPFVQLEAVFLRNFVEAMLPAEDAGSFGTGSAGEYWQSMLADEMAQAIAKNGRLGIADLMRESFRNRNSGE